MQVMVSRTVPEEFKSANFEIQLSQKRDPIVSYPWCLAMLTEALLENDDFFEAAAVEAKTRMKKVTKVRSSKKGIKISVGPQR